MLATARMRVFALPIALSIATTMMAGALFAGPAEASDITFRDHRIETAEATDLPPTKVEKLRRAVRIAKAQLGDPYSYGATGPGAFDCSGLTSYAYHRAGLTLPRTSSQQAGYTRNISRSAMRPGDLMFFGSGGGVYHVGMFVGRKNGRYMMLDAGSSGGHVSIRAPWTNSWWGGTVR